MLSSRWLQAALLGTVVMVGGCAVEQRHEAPSASHPVKEADKGEGVAPIVKEPSKPPAPSTTSGPVPSAPVTGGIGYYQDHQERVLTERLAGSGVRVLRNADTIKLIVPGNSAFALNSEQIQPSFTAVLDNIARVLKEYSKTVIDIKGYTDSTGSFEHNQQLSERRAQSVGSYFITRQIGAARIRSVGYGPRYPLAGNDTPTGRNQNRRVEIELVPIP